MVGYIVKVIIMVNEQYVFGKDVILYVFGVILDLIEGWSLEINIVLVCNNV